MNDFQVCWRGYVGGSTGYDRASREYLLALDRQGVDVKIEPMSYSNDIFIGGLNPDQVKRIQELINKPYADNKKKVLVYHAQPNGVAPDAERARYDKVVVLTVWETTKVPDNWIEPANKCDAVIVPSAQNIVALKDSGINVPLYMVPHGADIITYNPENPKLQLSNAIDKFTFLSVFQWQHRKAPEILLQAYWKEFTSRDNVCLIVKTYWGHVVNKNESRGIHNQIMNYKQSLGVTDSAPLYLTTSIFDDEDLKGLYTLADTFVLPTRGEGVGLPYIEALSSGIPVVATGWGGSMDFLNEDNAYLVDYDLLPVNAKDSGQIAPNFNQLFTGDMKWAEPQIDSLREQMRKAYAFKFITKQKGENGRKLMETMSWDNSGKQFKEILESICKQ
jgi:glycosyltransferase involved in cell wall biosynthesis